MYFVLFLQVAKIDFFESFSKTNTVHNFNILNSDIISLISIL